MFCALAIVLPGFANAQYNSYGNCTYHAYKLCVGSNIYWYDSCGTQQDLYTGCYNGQTCQYGQCTYNPILPQVQQVNTYNPYSTKACYGGSIHWFDSKGVESGLYKNCADSNSCTLDECSASKCLNTFKCDGSTCATSSADYNIYCAPAQQVQPVQPVQPSVPPIPAVNQNCGNGLCEPNLGETNDNCSNDCKIIQEPAIPDAVAVAAAVAPVSESVSESTGFMGFLKRWYLWILGILILIFLFVIVFKRFSSEV